MPWIEQPDTYFDIKEPIKPKPTEYGEMLRQTPIDQNKVKSQKLLDIGRTMHSAPNTTSDGSSSPYIKQAELWSDEEKARREASQARQRRIEDKVGETFDVFQADLFNFTTKDGKFGLTLNKDDINRDLKYLDYLYETYSKDLDSDKLRLLNNYTGKDRDLQLKLQDDIVNEPTWGLHVFNALTGGTFFASILDNTETFTEEEQGVIAWAKRWYEIREELNRAGARFSLRTSQQGMNTGFGKEGYAMNMFTGVPEKPVDNSPEIFVPYVGDEYEVLTHYTKRAMNGMWGKTIGNVIEEMASEPGIMGDASSNGLNDIMRKYAAINQAPYSPDMVDAEKAYKFINDRDESSAAYYDTFISVLGDIIELSTSMKYGGFKAGMGAFNKLVQINNATKKVKFLNSVKLDGLYKIPEVGKRYKIFNKLFNSGQRLKVGGTGLEQLTEIIGTKGEYIGRLAVGSFIDQMLALDPDAKWEDLEKNFRNMAVLGGFNYAFSKTFMKNAQFLALSSKLLNKVNVPGKIAAKLDVMGKTGVALGQFFAQPFQSLTLNSLEGLPWDGKQLMADAMFGLFMSYGDLMRVAPAKSRYNYFRERQRTLDNNYTFEEFLKKQDVRPGFKKTGSRGNQETYYTYEEMLEDKVLENAEDGYVVDKLETVVDGKEGYQIIKRKTFSKGIVDEAKADLGKTDTDEISATDMLDAYEADIKKLGISDEYFKVLKQNGANVKIVQSNKMGNTPAAIIGNTIFLNNGRNYIFTKKMSLRKAAATAMVHELTHNIVTNKLKTDPAFKKEMQKIYDEYYNLVKGYFETRKHKDAEGKATQKLGDILVKTYRNRNEDGTIDHETNLQEFVAALYEPSKKAGLFRQFTTHLSEGLSDRATDLVSRIFGTETSTFKKVNKLMLTEKAMTDNEAVIQASKMERKEEAMPKVSTEETSTAVPGEQTELFNPYGEEIVTEGPLEMSNESFGSDEFKSFFGKSKLTQKNFKRIMSDNDIGNTELFDERANPDSPIILYHGTTQSFDVFKEKRKDRGIYLTYSPDIANSYAKGSPVVYDYFVEPFDMEYIVGPDNESISLQKIGNQTIVFKPSEKFNNASEEMQSVMSDEDGFDLTLIRADGVEESIGMDKYNQMIREYNNKLESQLDSWGNVMPLVVNMENPAVLDLRNGSTYDIDKLVLTAKSRGHDGLIVKNVRDVIDRDGMGGGVAEQTQIIAFKPEQIKSAIGNRGTYDKSDPNVLHMSQESLGADDFAYNLDFAKLDYLETAMRDAVERAKEDIIEAKDFEEMVDIETLSGKLGFQDEDKLYEHYKDKSFTEIYDDLEPKIQSNIERANLARKLKSMEPIKSVSLKVNVSKHGANIAEINQNVANRIVTGAKRTKYGRAPEYLFNSIDNEIALMREYGLPADLIDIVQELFSKENFHRIQGYIPAQLKGESFQPDYRGVADKVDEFVFDSKGFGESGLMSGAFIYAKTTGQFLFKSNRLKQIMSKEPARVKQLWEAIEAYKFARFVDSDKTWKYNYLKRADIMETLKIMDLAKLREYAMYGEENGKINVLRPDVDKEAVKKDIERHVANKELLAALYRAYYTKNNGETVKRTADYMPSLTDMLDAFSSIIYNGTDTGQGTPIGKRDAETVKPVKSSDKYINSLTSEHYNKLIDAEDFLKVADDKGLRDESGKINEETLLEKYSSKLDKDGNIRTRTLTIDDELFNNMPEELQDEVRLLKHLLGEQTSDGAMIVVNDDLYRTFASSLGIETYNRLGGLKPKAVQIEDGNTRIMKAGLWGPGIAKDLANTSDIFSKLLENAKENKIGIIQFATASKSSHTRRVKKVQDEFDENVRYIMDNDNKLLYVEKKSGAEWKQDAELTKAYQEQLLSNIRGGVIPAYSVSDVPVTGKNGIVFENYLHDSRVSMGAANFDSVIGFNEGSEVFADIPEVYEALNRRINGNIEKEIEFGIKHYFTISQLGTRLMDNPNSFSSEVSLTPDETTALRIFTEKAIDKLQSGDEQVRKNVFYRYKMNYDDLLSMLKASLDDAGNFMPESLPVLLSVENLLSGRFLSTGETTLLSTLSADSIKNALKGRHKVMISKIAPDFGAFRKETAHQIVAHSMAQAELGVKPGEAKDDTYNAVYDSYLREMQEASAEFFDEYGRLRDDNNGVILSFDQYKQYASWQRRMAKAHPGKNFENTLKIGDPLIFTKVPADDMSNGIMAFRLAGISDKNGLTILPSKYVTELTGGDMDFDGISMWLPDDTMDARDVNTIYEGISSKRSKIEQLKKRSNEIKEMASVRHPRGTALNKYFDLPYVDNSNGPQFPGLYKRLISHQTGQNVGVSSVNDLSRGLRQIRGEMKEGKPSDVISVDDRTMIIVNTDITPEREAKTSFIKQTFVDSYEFMPIDRLSALYKIAAEGAEVKVSVNTPSGQAWKTMPLDEYLRTRRDSKEIYKTIFDYIKTKAGAEHKELGTVKSVEKLIDNLLDEGIHDEVSPYTTYTKTMSEVKRRVRKEQMSDDMVRLLKEKEIIEAKYQKSVEEAKVMLEKARQQFKKDKNQDKFFDAQTDVEFMLSDAKTEMNNNMAFVNSEMAQAEYRPKFGLEIAGAKLRGEALNAIESEVQNKLVGRLKDELYKIKENGVNVGEAIFKQVFLGFGLKDGFKKHSALYTIQEIIADLQYLMPEHNSMSKGHNPYEEYDANAKVYVNKILSKHLLNFRTGGANMAKGVSGEYQGDYLWASDKNLVHKIALGSVARELLNMYNVKPRDSQHPQHKNLRFEEGLLKLYNDNGTVEKQVQLKDIFNEKGMLQSDWIPPDVLQSRWLYDNLLLDTELTPMKIEEIKANVLANLTDVLGDTFAGIDIGISKESLYTALSFYPPPESRTFISKSGAVSGNPYVRGSLANTKYVWATGSIKNKEGKRPKQYDWLASKNREVTQAEAAKYFSENTGDNIFRFLDTAQKKGIEPEISPGILLKDHYVDKLINKGRTAVFAKGDKSLPSDDTIKTMSGGTQKTNPNDVKRALEMSAETLEGNTLDGIDVRTQVKFRRTFFEYMARSGNQRLINLSAKSPTRWSNQDLEYVNDRVIKPWLKKILPVYYARYTSDEKKQEEGAINLINSLSEMITPDVAGNNLLNRLERIYVGKESNARVIAKQAKNVTFLMALQRALATLDKAGKSNIKTTSFRIWGTRIPSKLAEEFTSMPKLIAGDEIINTTRTYVNGRMTREVPVYAKDIIDHEYGVQLPFRIASEHTRLMQKMNEIAEMQSHVSAEIDYFTDEFAEEDNFEASTEKIRDLSGLKYVQNLLDDFEFYSESINGQRSKLTIKNKRTGQVQNVMEDATELLIREAVDDFLNRRDEAIRTGNYGHQDGLNWDNLLMHIEGDKGKNFDETKEEERTKIANKLTTYLKNYLRYRGAIESYRNSILAMRDQLLLTDVEGMDFTDEVRHLDSILKQLSDLSPDGVQRLTRSFGADVDISDKLNEITERLIGPAIESEIEANTRRDTFNKKLAKKHSGYHVSKDIKTSIYHHGRQHLTTMVKRMIEDNNINRTDLDELGAAGLPDEYMLGYGEGDNAMIGLAEYINKDIDSSPQFQLKEGETEAQLKARKQKYFKQVLKDILSGYNAETVYGDVPYYYQMFHEMGVEGYEKPWNRVSTDAERKLANQAKAKVEGLVRARTLNMAKTARLGRLGGEEVKVEPYKVYNPDLNKSTLDVTGVTLEDVYRYMKGGAGNESLQHSFTKVQDDLLRAVSTATTSVSHKFLAKYRSNPDMNEVANMNVISELTRATGLPFNYVENVDLGRANHEIAVHNFDAPDSYYLPKGMKPGTMVQIAAENSNGGVQTYNGHLLGVIKVPEVVMTETGPMKKGQAYYVVTDLNSTNSKLSYIAANKVANISIAQMAGIKGRVELARQDILEGRMKDMVPYLKEVNKISKEGRRTYNRWDDTAPEELSVDLKAAKDEVTFAHVLNKLADLQGLGQTLLYYFRARHLLKGAIGAATATVAGYPAIGLARFARGTIKYAKGALMGIHLNNRLGFLSGVFMNALPRKSDDMLKKVLRPLADVASNFMGKGDIIDEELVRTFSPALIALKRGASNQEVNTYLKEQMETAIERSLMEDPAYKRKMEEKVGTKNILGKPLTALKRRNMSKKILKEFESVDEGFTANTAAAEALRNALDYIDFKPVTIKTKKRERGENGEYIGETIEERTVFVPKVKGMTDQESAYVVSMMDQLMKLFSLNNLIVHNELSSAKMSITAGDRLAIQRWKREYLSTPTEEVSLPRELQKNLLERWRAFGVGDFRRNLQQRSPLGKTLLRFGAFGFEKGQDATKYALARNDFYKAYQEYVGKEDWTKFKEMMNGVGIPIGEYYMVNPREQILKAVSLASSKFLLVSGMNSLLSFLGNMWSNDKFDDSYLTLPGFVFGPLESSIRVLAGLINLFIFTSNKNPGNLRDVLRAPGEAVGAVTGKGMADAVDLLVAALYEAYSGVAGVPDSVKRDEYNRIQKQQSNAFLDVLNYLFPGAGSVAEEAIQQSMED